MLSFELEKLAGLGDKEKRRRGEEEKRGLGTGLN